MADILIVDDEVLSALYLAAHLTDEGHAVRTAANGEQALRALDDFTPEVLITDWKLGGAVDGVQLAHTLLNRQPMMSVIIYSGLPGDELRAKLGDVKVTAVLQKPCGIDEILPLLNGTVQ